MAPLIHTHGGWKFGQAGKIYRGPNARQRAARQGRAIKASQCRGEFFAISRQADRMIRATKPIQTTNQRPTTPKTMRFGGAAGKQKVLRRFIFPPVTMGTTRAAQRRGLPKRIHARIAANIVLGRPRVNGYMYEPPKKTTPAKVEVFLTLKDFKSQLKPVLTHELTHLRDYVTKGTAHTKESEDKAYSYQWATQQRLTPPKRVPRSRPSIDPPHDTTWALWALRDPRYNARLDRLIDELDETKM